MTQLSKADREQIEAAVQRAEAETSTELVVAVIAKSSDYRFHRLLGAFAWTLATQLLVARWLEAHVFWLVLGALPVAWVAYALFGLPVFGRLMVPKAYADRKVEERAFQLFAERGLHQTRDRTGMLILISELEHRVLILGDVAIHEHVGDEGWEAHVAHIVQAIKRGELVRGVVEVVERLGAVHAQHLPRRPDDSNELPDVIVGDG
jgi:putative membrane protein